MLHCLFVRSCQILQQNPPAYAVHDQMVYHQQQSRASFSQIDREHSNQRAFSQIEAFLRVGRRLLYRLFLPARINFRQIQNAEDRVRLGFEIFLRPSPAFFCKSHPQRIVVLQETGRRLIQRARIEPLLELEY